MDSITRCFVIQPQRSLSWRGAVLFWLAMATVSLLIAGAFAWAGAWPVLPFAGLELLALAIGLYLSIRSGHWREVIKVSGTQVEVERGYRGPEQRWSFPRAWTRVDLIRPARGWYPNRLRIGTQSRYLAIGTCLTDAEREQLAQALRAALRDEPAG